eukprot:GHVU01139222.1.p3 GENE.GHVU01139222.1~~GHVU01139222.1.p3  ORF type:complete len:116 (+),score=19.09 GHVU01139222.1:510-857(+)
MDAESAAVLSTAMSQTWPLEANMHVQEGEKKKNKQAKNMKAESGRHQEQGKKEEDEGGDKGGVEGVTTAITTTRDLHHASNGSTELRSFSSQVVQVAACRPRVAPLRSSFFRART